MEKSTFVRLLKNSNKIKGIDISYNFTDDVIHADKIKYVKARKTIYFNNADEKAVIAPFHIRDIQKISRVDVGNANKYKFLLQLKDNALKNGGIKMFVDITMKPPYSPYLLDKYEIENYKQVEKSIPKYLCTLKGKTVKVRYSQYSEIFSTYNRDIDGGLNIVTSAYIIDNFDYSVSMESSVPVLKMYNSRNINICATVLAVCFICGDEKSSITVGSENNGEYFLTVI